MSGDASLLYLERRAREAENRSELAFVIVNESIGLQNYRQAILLFGGRIEAVSGTPVIARTGPYLLFMRRLARHLASRGEGAVIFSGATLPEALGAEWREMAGGTGLLLSGRRSGIALLLLRDAGWEQREVDEMAALMDAYDHAWIAFRRRSVFSHGARPWLRRLLFVALSSAVVAGAALIPVPLTVLAPAEVVPIDPVLVRAPLDGVIEKVLVTPNQSVKTQQPLIILDTTTTQSRLDVASQELTAAEAEYRQAAQLAVYDARGKAQLAGLAGRVAAKMAEVNYYRSLVGRSTVTSMTDGVVLMEDPTTIIGRAVVQGERLLLVASDSRTELEIWVQPGDLIDGIEQAMVFLFPNASPLGSVRARTYYVSYQASARPDGSYAYRLRARFDEAEPPRLGMLGVARLSISDVSLFYWVFRRPLAALRQAVGF